MAQFIDLDFGQGLGHRSAKADLAGGFFKLFERGHGGGRRIVQLKTRQTFLLIALEKARNKAAREKPHGQPAASKILKDIEELFDARAIAAPIHPSATSR